MQSLMKGECMKKIMMLSADVVQSLNYRGTMATAKLLTVIRKITAYQHLTYFASGKYHKQL